jgi:hypothetical protein
VCFQGGALLQSHGLRRGRELGGQGAQVMIEADGPARFSNNSHRPLGRTVARRAMLEARGHAVRSIPFYEWAALGSVDQQKTYLWRLLASTLRREDAAALQRGAALVGQLSG